MHDRRSHTCIEWRSYMTISMPCCAINQLDRPSIVVASKILSGAGRPACGHARALAEVISAVLRRPLSSNAPATDRANERHDLLITACSEQDASSGRPVDRLLLYIVLQASTRGQQAQKLQRASQNLVVSMYPVDRDHAYLGTSARQIMTLVELARAHDACSICEAGRAVDERSDPQSRGRRLGIV